MTVASLSGRSVEFKKGVPTLAPPQMHAELIAKGVVPETESEEPVEVNPDQGPQIPYEREEALFAAFEKLAKRNKRGDFTAGGAPHAAVLAKELGWTDVDVKERDAAWTKFQQKE